MINTKLIEFYSVLFDGSTRKIVLDAKNPTTFDMLHALEKIQKKSGASKLAFDPEPDIGVFELRVESDSKKYLLTLLEYREDGSVHVREKVSTNVVNRLVEFEGELYPPRAVITDFDFVKRVFAEFLETGNVSYDLMD